jgi:enoyl-CoA hydratase
MTEPVVRLEARGPVATITLNRPRARNAISSELLGALVEAMAGADADGDIRAVVLTGADPAFCAGVDLKEAGRETSLLSGPGSGSHTPWPPISKPVIAAVNGAAVMSFTGDFLTAAEALAAGLVSEVVPHDGLIGRAHEIAGNDDRAVRALLASYRQVEAGLVGDGYDAEGQASAAWRHSGLDLAETSRRRAAITERGRAQASGGQP